jgi:hypothetical protein
MYQKEKKKAFAWELSWIHESTEKRKRIKSDDVNRILFLRQEMECDGSVCVVSSGWKSVMLGRIKNEFVANRVKEMMLSDDVHDVISRHHTNTSRSPSRPPQNGVHLDIGIGFRR